MKYYLMPILLFSLIQIPVFAKPCQKLLAKEIFKTSVKMVAARNKRDPFKGVMLRKRFRELKDTKAFFKDAQKNGINGDEVKTFLKGISSKKQKVGFVIIQKLLKKNAYCFIPKTKEPLMFVSLEDLAEGIEEGFFEKVFKAKGI